MITSLHTSRNGKIWSDENRYNCWLEVEIF